MLFALKRSTSPVAYCALSVKTGTRYEDPKYNGLAHLIEHMLFKGTERRTSNSINNVLEREGGELNAYTTKEDIVLYSTVLCEDLPKAVDLLAELALTSTFPAKELEKELDVIYDEIISYKDSPAESIYDHFETLLFKGHPLEKPILGEKKTLRKVTSSVLKEFLTANFTPENMVLTVVGNIEEKQLHKLIQKSLAKYRPEQEFEIIAVAESDKTTASNKNTYPADRATENNTNTYPYRASENNTNTLPYRASENNTNPLPDSSTTTADACANAIAIGQKFHTEIAKRNHQAHCIIGGSAYSYYSGWKRTALALLTNILGGPASSSRLNMTLREKHALVYNIDANYTPYSDTGIFSIYFGCDKSLLAKCRELVYKELEKITSTPLTERELKNAKKQFLGQLFISQDNAEAQCLAMGKSINVYNKIEPFAKTREQIEKISSEQLLQVAGEILATERLSELIYK